MTELAYVSKFKFSPFKLLGKSMNRQSTDPFESCECLKSLTRSFCGHVEPLFYSQTTEDGVYQWIFNKTGIEYREKTIQKMESGKVTYVDYHQEDEKMSTSYLLAPRLHAIGRTQRKSIAKGTLTPLGNSDEESEWRGKKLLFRTPADRKGAGRRY